VSGDRGANHRDAESLLFHYLTDLDRADEFATRMRDQVALAALAEETDVSDLRDFGPAEPQKAS
jgi:hypothetical protein